MKKHLLLTLLVLAISAPVSAQNIVADTASMMVNIKEIMVLSSQTLNDIEKPVVMSAVSAKQIKAKLSNKEFPEILNYTPSIYASKMGGGYGDSRITLRGFGSENISTLINGVPINGMENGAVYWSNWAGIADVAHRIQVQRGIGISKLGLYSVGGTINIVTNGANTERGGWVSYDMGNDGYQKMGFSVSTGQTSNGWALSLMGMNTSGDGYVDGTNFECWSYFGNLSKRFNDRHSLSFTFLGAYQWHNRRSNKHLIADYDSKGIRMNSSYGYVNGEIVSSYSGYNEYHKPQLSLNHFWKVGHKASITTSLYASMSTGGGRKVSGVDANRIQYNYKDGRPIYDKEGNMVSNLRPDGLIDYEPLMNDNRKSETGSRAIFATGTNSHNWFGGLSTFNQPLGERFNLSAGVDVRYYKGYHFDRIENLLGGSHYTDNSLAWREKDRKLYVGDKINFDYYSEILWLGVFSQLEYNSEHIQTFISATATNHKYKRVDDGRYGVYGDQEKYPTSGRMSSWRDFVPVSVKAGFNYRFTENHRAFVNGGYITKAPVMETIYVDNTYLANPENEKITSFELGYTYSTEKVRAQVNGYITNWKDKSTAKNIGSWNGPRACIPNLDALHQGIEFEVSYAPISSLRFDGFVTVGDWRWKKDVYFALVNDKGEVTGEYNAYIKDLKVGNAPQTSAYLSATWECMDGLRIGADFNYYADHYADFSAIDRTKKDDRAQSWKLPDYSTVDLNMSYEFKFHKVSLTFFGNVNNLFNTKHITDALDGATHKRDDALVWYGFGTTWSTGIRLKF